MLDTIKQFLKEHEIDEKAGFIIAVSGGADSITLLHAFKYLNLRIHALHCNFNLRGKESNMDEQFVKRFCETYGIPMSVKRFDTQEYAKKKGISIEMAARELRYDWFEEMRQKKKMDYIVVGHHANDLAETLFINICRGTGIKGLTGIRPVKDRILRPLLSRSREEIIAYIEQNQLGYRTDSTNNSLDYVRNKIRHMIIPVCKDINPSFLNTVRENCNTLKEVEQIYRYGIDRLKEEVISEENGETLIDIQKTLAAPAPYT
ncbi:MAG TPA: tRNA lysidine(34) synthetase TilS, partial [Butyricimonas virosa]|nr:tRNA lysidine(34) synthetase TilS [Butyricimonas virosa]